MNYRYALSESESHLGGNIIEGDYNTFSPNVWDYLINRFAVRTVTDIGSGIGYASHYFSKQCKVIAVDGLTSNVKNAIYPTIKHDFTRGIFKTSPVDLVYCVEVAEHIDEMYVDNLLASLAHGKFVLMTHALPGQSGHHHVNLQPQGYWLEKLALYGLQMLPEDTARVRAIADQEGSPYIGQTGMVLANRNL
jgi:hypothetical protein